MIGVVVVLTPAFGFSGSSGWWSAAHLDADHVSPIEELEAQNHRVHPLKHEKIEKQNFDRKTFFLISKTFFENFVVRKF
mgnify:CR=1 FL=1